MTCGIYKLTSASGNCYIGSSKRIERRLNVHKRMLVTRSHENPRLQAAFDKHGEFHSEILIVCAEQDLLTYEQICIDHFLPAYNRSPIAGRPAFSPEAKARISAKNKARVWTSEMRERQRRNQLGRVYSEEVRRKVSEALRRRVITDETRAKLKTMNIGRKASPEARKNLSLAAMGKLWTAEKKKKVSLALKGRPKSALTRKKMSEAKKGKGGRPMPDHVKEMLRQINTGRKMSAEVIAQRVKTRALNNLRRSEAAP